MTLLKKIQRMLRLLNDRYPLAMRFAKIGIIISLFIYFSAVLMVIFENHINSDQKISSIADGIWWSIVTITTVGYGDKVPFSHEGRIFASVFIFVGFILFSLLTGIITSILVEEKMKGDKGLKTIKKSGHIVVCGWNETLEILLHSLSQKEDFFSTIVFVGNYTSEFFREIESKYPSLKISFVRGDYAKEEILKRANVANANQVLVFADKDIPKENIDDKSIVTATAIRFVSATVPLTVQLINQNNKSHLKQIKVNNILSIDEMGAYLMANNIFEKNFLNFHNDLIHSINKMKTLPIPISFVGREYQELVKFFYDEKGVVLLGILSKNKELELADIFSDDSSAIDSFIKSALEHTGQKTISKENEIVLNPPKDYHIEANDIAIILG